MDSIISQSLENWKPQDELSFPPPMSLDGASATKPSMPLDPTTVLPSSWAWWYDDAPPKGISQSSYENIIKPILEPFNTIPAFLRFWAHLSDISILPHYSNLRLFRDGVKPLWEDPNNKSGGKWVIHIPFGDAPPGPSSSSIPPSLIGEITRVWYKLVLLTITDRLPYVDDVCGIVIRVRPEEVVLQVWTRTLDVGDPNTKFGGMKEALHKALNLPSTLFVKLQEHQTSLDFTKNFVHIPKSKRRGSAPNITPVGAPSPLLSMPMHRRGSRIGAPIMEESLGGSDPSFFAPLGDNPNMGRRNSRTGKTFGTAAPPPSMGVRYQPPGARPRASFDAGNGAPLMGSPSLSQAPQPAAAPSSGSTSPESGKMNANAAPYRPPQQRGTPLMSAVPAPASGPLLPTPGAPLLPTPTQASAPVSSSGPALLPTPTLSSVSAPLLPTPATSGNALLATPVLPTQPADMFSFKPQQSPFMCAMPASSSPVTTPPAPYTPLISPSPLITSIPGTPGSRGGPRTPTLSSFRDHSSTTQLKVEELQRRVASGPPPLFSTWVNSPSTSSFISELMAVTADNQNRKPVSGSTPAAPIEASKPSSPPESPAGTRTPTLSAKSAPFVPPSANAPLLPTPLLGSIQGTSVFSPALGSMSAKMAARRASQPAISPMMDPFTLSGSTTPPMAALSSPLMRAAPPMSLNGDDRSFTLEQKESVA
eukprot:TRINITY_DN281_c0_g1_i3.p1 TRINITY_DN281_c0_g1~~TRINITY_DN281_c0_g1_i3.p1  ORF type:complete len:705 (-),score=199.83 TRINITY_DN281_c0_g1_i3:116-2230(-)